MSMAMHPRDLRSFLEAQNRERTPEEQEHDRRLGYRVDEYRVHFTPGPMGHPIDQEDDQGFTLVVTERAGDLQLLRPSDTGLGVSHYGGRTREEGLDEHGWEEQGHVTTYPWHRIAFFEHRWWIDEDAAKATVPDPGRPGQYL